MSSASVDETNGGHPPSENGHDGRHCAAAAPSSSSSSAAAAAAAAAGLESAIAHADVYRGRGTTYLHIDDPFATTTTSSDDSPSAANPTGAVVPAISLATTFRQSSPGVPTAKDDPNSFGMGYEYSRTGERGEKRAAAVMHAVGMIHDDGGIVDRRVFVFILTLPFDVLCASHIATTTL
jgi:hypothetical protein